MKSDKYTHIPHLREHVAELPPHSIVSRTIFEDARQKVVLFGFAPGEALSEHTASSPAVIHILSGEAKITLGTEQLQADEGTWIHIEAHLPHSIYAKSETLMLLTLIKS